MTSRTRISLALVGLVALVVVGWFVGGGTDRAPRPPAASKHVAGAESGLRVVRLSTLPPQVGSTWRLIRRGGPFPSGRDGSVFGNREDVLPDKPRGYYREYTVPTPGSPDRGARRVVTGKSAELYYTSDHYESFVVVDADS